MGVDTPRNPKRQSGGSISYHSILVAALSSVGGAAAVLIVLKAMGDGSVTFSVTGIISFLFGIALSSASIVLAVAAISFGRTSERIVVERSDESIRLQNEVFAKTTEALGRIESSTGVTEKRIEDIIAGRAGAIAERLVENRPIGSRSRAEIEKEIRESLRDELPASMAAPYKPKSKELEAKSNEANANYEKFNEKILFHISDQATTKTRKMGYGKFRASGDDLADGVFETPSGRVAVCTFSTDPVISHRFGSDGEFEGIINSLLTELASGVFSSALLVFDNKLDSDTAFKKQLESAFKVARKDLVSRIDVVSGDLPEILETLSKKFATS